MSIDALSKHYEAADVESKWLNFWLDRDYFHADETAASVPYSITLPPPNVTGSLHMGHALGSTLQDILVRWRRMQGHNAMWMPGTDHAGIATQMLVVRHLKETEGKSRFDIGREAFLQRMWTWKERHGGRIQEQMKTMGFSLDWVRERFTLDDGASAAVREVFVRLYEEGLIYRAHRLVNWCTDCFTAVSDLEVNNVEEKGSLWELEYPVVGSDRRITVATTRPETMLGDTGVAVHPDDERYRELLGKHVVLPLCDREIPIVADDFVDPEFGSGAVKVTPAHDFNDFECGQRSGLAAISVIDQRGCITEEAPEKYRGMTALEARRAVVSDLEEGGFLGHIKDYTVPIGRCDRSGTVIEPLLSEQWWVKTEPLAKPAIAAVEDRRTQFVPELWSKTYMHWMTNIKDWCISRQLWWGHRIPAWYCDECGEVTVARAAPAACQACSSAKLRQDEDVLDTWFSSALWPFSTLGWPEKSEALSAFYPTSVLVTAPDIIFFWVARMMMMGLHFAGDVPFRHVFLTPIVTDEHGEKMSKVKGNVVDPLHVVQGASLDELLEGASGNKAATKFIKKNMPKGIPPAGSDALRFSLSAMAMPGRNIRLSMERIEGYRHFINKLWNASRFSLMNLEGFDADRFVDWLERFGQPGFETEHSLSLPDRWILSRLQTCAAAVNEALEAFRFSDAAHAIYHFVWGELCDWHIELCKPNLRGGEDAEAASRQFIAQGTLATVLESVLRLMHPFTPFVTEEIWHQLPKSSACPESLMVTVFPQAESRFIDREAEQRMDLLMGVTTAIRSIRSTYNVPPSRRIAVQVRAPADDKRAILEAETWVVETAARVTVALSETGGSVPSSAKSIVGSDIEVVVPLEGVVNIEAEKKRITKEIAKTDKEIAFVEKKLGNENFLARAPDDVVAKEREKLAGENERRARLSEALEGLS